jgi:iron complex outermembrane receptor protein
MLKQIEILKGPQGAIYGRNAAAGAIIVSTRKPTDEFEMEFKGSAAEDNTYAGSGYVAGALKKGSAWYSVQGNYRDTDGYYSNEFRGGDIVDDFESWDVTGRLVWEPSSNLSIDTKFHYGEVDAASITFNAAFALPDFAQVPVPGFEFFSEDVNDHDFVYQTNIDPQNDQDTTEFSTKLDYDFDDGRTLTGWFLYSDINNSLSADGTSGAFGFFNLEPNCINTSTTLFNAGLTLPPPQVLAPSDGSAGFDPIFGPYTPTSCDGTQYQERNQTDYSFEMRLASAADQRMRWLTGVYYLNIEREVGVNLGIDQGGGVQDSLFVPQSGINPTEQLAHDDFDSDVYAFFGQLQFDVTDTFEWSAALRYDSEDRDVSNKVPTAPRTQYVDYTLDGQSNGGAPLNPGLDPTINPSGEIRDKTQNFDKWQPKISGTWDVTDGATLYGSWGRGFKAGGFNNQGSNATVEIFYNQPLGLDLLIEDQFREETSDAYELGVKSQWFGGRLSVDAAVYHTDVSDMQFFEFLVGPFGLLRVVSNIDDVDINGFELGADFAATDWLTLQGGFNWIDSEINDNSSRPDTVGNDSPYTPEYNHNVNALIDFPITRNLDFFAGAYWTLVGETWFHTVQDNTRTTLFELGFPGLGTADYSVSKRDSYDTLDVRVGIQGDNWAVTAFGTNVTDEDFLEEVITAPEFGGEFIHPGTESRWGVEFRVGFGG